MSSTIFERNESRYNAINFTEIKRIVREYYIQSYANQFFNLDKINKF